MSDSEHKNIESKRSVYDTCDPAYLRELREAAGMDLTVLARTACLSVAQVRELEDGGMSHFTSHDMKVQAALKVATTLSGAQANGMPVVNVFRSRAAGDGLGVQLPPIKMEEAPPPKPKFPDSPEFFKLVLIFVVMAFLLVAVAMPLLYTLPSPPPKLV